jgi:hypothetical protein
MSGVDHVALALIRPIRAVSALSLAATACLLFAACGGASGGNATGGATGGAASTGGSAGGGGGSAGASVIPAGSTAAAQLKALKNCKPTPGDGSGSAPLWLVTAGGANPTYSVPTGSPKVGKSLSGWPTTPMVVLGDCQNTESWTFAAADSKNFYLAVQVDSTLSPVQGTSAAPWTGDVVQFAIDPLDDKNQGSYDTNDDEMGMLLQDDGTAFLFDNDQGGQEVTPFTIPGGAVSITRNNGITLYECSIPWSSIGATVNNTFGFNIAVAAGGPPYQGPNWGYEWTQGIIEGKNPADFAQLTVKK